MGVQRRSLMAGLLALAVVACGHTSHVGDATRDGDAADTALPDTGVGDAALPDTGLGDAAVPLRPVCWEVSASMTEERSLALAPAISTADVFFLMDVTASMQEEIDVLTDVLTTTVVPALRDGVPNVHYALGTFADFPVAPYGNADAGDAVFEMLQTSTSDPLAAQAAFSRISLGNGRDEPESLVEALYLSITGEGLSPYSAAAACPAGTIGHPCFRPGSVPVYLVFTDAPTHQGPDGSEPYAGIVPSPHTYEEAGAALLAAGVRVLAMDSGTGSAVADLSALATTTGMLRADGTPLVFDIGRRGERLGAGVVAAITDLLDEVPMRVTLSIEDVDGDGEDAAAWFAAPRLEGVDPPEAMIADVAGVVEVRPGARLSYALEVSGPDVLPTSTQRVKVLLREQAGSEVARVDIDLPQAAVGCP